MINELNLKPGDKLRWDLRDGAETGTVKSFVWVDDALWVRYVSDGINRIFRTSVQDAIEHKVEAND